MKILFYGAGVLGSLYAARLHDHGLDVSILARGSRLTDIREHGVVLEDMKTGEQSVSHVKVVEQLNPSDYYDIAILFMRKNQALSLLPKLSENTRIPAFLFMGNNAAGFDKYAEVLGKNRVLLGFGSAGGIRKGHVIHYIVESKNEVPMIIGEQDGSITPRLKQIRQEFAPAGVKVSFSKNIDAYLKTHAAVVAPLACAVYSAAGDNYRLSRTREALVLYIRAVREEFKVLGKLGISITPTTVRMLGWLPESILILLMRRSLNTEQAEIGLAGHANAARDEFKQITEELHELSQKTGVATPSMDYLCKFIDSRFPPLPGGR